MNIAQGVENAGKALVVGEDGNVVPSAAVPDKSVTVAKLADDVLELLSSSGDSSAGGDTLKGSLPYTITETGCYIIANSDTSVNISSDNSQLLDFNSATLALPSSTYNHAAYEIVDAKTIDISFIDDGGNAVVYVSGLELQPDTDYTVFAKYEPLNGAPDISSRPYIRFLSGTVQLSMDVSGYTAKSLTSNSNGELGGTGTNGWFIGLPKVTNITAGDTYRVSVLIYQGTLTEVPGGSADIQISAGEKYNTDGYLGKKLTGNDPDIPIYVYLASTEDAKVVTDTDGVIFCGDSILDYSGIPAMYATKTGKSVIDCAVGGTRMSGSRDSTNEYYPYDMTNIADAIASGDFSAQINGGKNSQFSTLATAELSNYKAIILEFGTNDFTAGVPFKGDDVTTLAGALKYILTTILTAYPDMRIVVLSTLQFVTLGSGSESGVPTHADGTVWEMNEIIKSVCENDAYCVPFVDMYHAMGENPLTRNTLTSDGCHLMSPNGVQRYLDILVGKLNELGI